MNKNSVIETVATIIIVALNFISNGADVKYQIVDLGTLGGVSSYANAINASGHVVGNSAINNGDSHAFVWYNGSMQDLGTLGGNKSYASAINDLGQIVGYSSITDNSTYRGYLYSNHSMQDLGTLGGTSSYARDINNSGQIVGDSINNEGTSSSFIFHNGLMQDLYISDKMNSAMGINNLGHITGHYYPDSGGRHSFLYINGVIKCIALTSLGPATYSINNNGQVAGFFIVSGGTHPYLYDGIVKDLGTLGGVSAWSYSINSFGDIVGYSQTLEGDSHAFIYSNGEMKDLNNMLIDTNNIWLLHMATGINDVGQIVGNGVNPSGQKRAFLLNPVPMAQIEAISNTIPSQLTLGICPVKDPTKNSLVVITHGWQPSFLPRDINFIDEMTINIINNLSGRNINNWQVFGYKWTTNASVPNPSDALNNAKQEGKHLGESIVAQGWTHVHFIAHSAGAALIQSATEIIKKSNSSIVVHETFLDPFVGFDSAGVYTYGRRADWSDQYFSRDNLTELAGFVTELPTFHSYNVDVSFLDPHGISYSKFTSMPDSSLQITEMCTKYMGTTHGWPVEFYMNTITGNTTTDYAGFGFSLSKEGGNWNAVSGYDVGNGTEINPSVPVRVLGTNMVCTAVTPKTSSYSDFIPDFTKSPMIQSETGIIQKYMDNVSLLSGSPVWLSTVIIPTNPVNFVSFDAEFTSSVGAQGVLIVLWGTNIIGTLDERFIEPGLQHYSFSFPRAEAYSPYVLGLRLDPFINIQSSVTLTNVVFNYVGVTQPFSLSITKNAVNNMRVWRLDGEAGFNYNIQASTNLNSSDWTDIAILENTNGVVFFYDADQNIYNQRFYRAVAPY